MNLYLIILVVILLELLTLLCILAALMSAHLRKSAAKVRRLRRLWSRLFPEALTGRPEAIQRIRGTLRAKADFVAFHDFLDDQLRDLHGGSPILLRHLSRTLGFTNHLQEQLRKSRDRLDRAKAAKTLGRLRESVARGAVVKLLHSRDPAVVLAAGYAVASFRDPRYFLPVLHSVYKRTPITLHGTAELLSGFGIGVCPVIHEVLDELVGMYELESPRRSSALPAPYERVDRGDVAAQVVMIDLLAFYDYAPAASSLLRLLESSEHEEVLIHLVKAIAKIGYTPAVPRLAEFLIHPNWVLRSQAAEAMAKLHATDTAPQIRSLLGDSNLQVRASAERALQNLKTVDETLEAFA